MEKLCVFCESFYFDIGCSGFSDLTPGYDTEICCTKKVWEMTNGDDDEDFRENILLAKTCKHFTPCKEE